MLRPGLRPAGRAPAAHAGHAAAGQARPAHEAMGHGGEGGMSMTAMVADMRNRFLVAVVFSVPIVIWSPIGRDVLGLHVPVPFGLRTDVWALLLSLPVIFYSCWIFFDGAGAKIATDGAVEDGESEVDESMVTGESLPVHKQPGSAVTGATINTNGTLRVRATKIGADTAPAQIVKLVMLTGDNQATAQRIAQRLGIGTVVAEVLPGDKAAKIAELQRGGRKVAMAGDGVNDAPALAQADLGIAIGAGTDVAIETADVVLMRSDPLGVPTALRVGRGTLRKMRQNLGWAIGYNSIALPIAAGVFAPAIGLVLRPEIAALTMAGSSIIVAVNALSLRRLRLPGRAKRAVADPPQAGVLAGSGA
jgi:soluble P-type ATPase